MNDSTKRVAIVGSGPAAFYSAMELLRHDDPMVSVDMLERLPTPYGLVRGGVAPDHEKIKSVTKIKSCRTQDSAFLKCRICRHPAD